MNHGLWRAHPKESFRNMKRKPSHHLLSSLILVVGTSMSYNPVGAEETDTQTSHFLRGAYQYGWVLQTNEFVAGDNLEFNLGYWFGL